MSDTQPTYGEPVYRPPTRSEFRQLLRRWELTGSATGKLACLTDRQVRRYAGGQTDVPYTVLFTLSVKCEGIQVEPGRWRAQLQMSTDVEEQGDGVRRAV